MTEIIELEEISICPECGSRMFEIVETISSDGPYCRCSQCKWESKDDTDDIIKEAREEHRRGWNEGIEAAAELYERAFNRARDATADAIRKLKK